MPFVSVARNQDVLSQELGQKSSPFNLSGNFVSRASCGKIGFSRGAPDFFDKYAECYLENCKDAPFCKFPFR